MFFTRTCRLEIVRTKKESSKKEKKKSCQNNYFFGNLLSQISRNIMVNFVCKWVQEVHVQSSFDSYL